MRFENFLDFFTHHVEAIIQWLFLFILVLIGLLISRGLLGKKESEASAAGAKSAEMDEVLQRILEQTKKLESMPLAQMSPTDVAQVDQQVQTLKKDLQAREIELAALKASGNPVAGAPGADATALNAKIKELEAKLAEYEILEDDIADLSLYKEENSRLKGELDKLKGKAETQGNEIVSKFEEAVAQEAAPATEADLKVPDTGDPLKDFQSTVQIERQMQGKAPLESPTTAETATATATASPSPAAAPVPSAEPAAPPATATATATATAAPAEPAAAFPTAPQPAASAPSAFPTNTAAAPASEPAEASDIFAEFATETPEEGDEALDTDRMMAEMEQLVSIQPTGDNALEESIDTEKMAAEASNLAKS